MWVIPLYIHSLYCENGGGAMKTVLLQIIFLLFCRLVGVTIIAVALIITLVIILSKKNMLCWNEPKLLNKKF